MSRSFHVIREVVRREVVLCHAEDEDAARRFAGRGLGEMIDSTEEGRVLNVEETPHSKRRRTAGKVAALAPDAEMSLGAGAQGDDLLTSGHVTILDSGEEPDGPAPVLHVGHIPQPQGGDGYPDGRWRDMQPGEVPWAGDEYRLNPRYDWEPVTRTLAGCAISRQARAQFRTRRP